MDVELGWLVALLGGVVAIIVAILTLFDKAKIKARKEGAKDNILKTIDENVKEIKGDSKKNNQELINHGMILTEHTEDIKNLEEKVEDIKNERRNLL